jgi:RND family efflux transporter MFP subunit
MIAFLVICYSVFYWLLFIKLRLLEKNARSISVFVGVGVALIGSIVFMWLTFAPTTKDGQMFQYVVQIVPNVKGQVVEVPVEPLVPLAAGDVLYRIDPTPYQAAVDQLIASIDKFTAQQQRAQIEVDRNQKLVKKGAGAQQDLDRWTASLDEASATIRSLEAQLRAAQWQLDETVVRAPGSGYVFNLQVRPGTYVTNMPLAASMTFISNELREVLASFSQSAGRHVQAGDLAEVVFSHVPGRVFSGKVSAVMNATGTAQLAPSGELPVLTGQPSAGRYPFRVALEDEDADALIPQGASGMVAVYTQRGKPLHIITKVVMRMQAWLGYLTSPSG